MQISGDDLMETVTSCANCAAICINQLNLVLFCCCLLLAAVSIQKVSANAAKLVENITQLFPTELCTSRNMQTLVQLLSI